MFAHVIRRALAAIAMDTKSAATTSVIRNDRIGALQFQLSFKLGAACDATNHSSHSIDQAG